MIYSSTRRCRLADMVPAVIVETAGSLILRNVIA